MPIRVEVRALCLLAIQGQKVITVDCKFQKQSVLDFKWFPMAPFTTWKGLKSLLESSSGPKGAINVTKFEENISKSVGWNAHFLMHIHFYMAIIISVLCCIIIWPLVKMILKFVYKLLSRRVIHEDQGNFQFFSWKYDAPKYVLFNLMLVCLKPQANFPAQNLNFHWWWRWWDQIQATF